MTAEAGQLQLQLFTQQNSDGGWGYQPGTSWTEPTALALLALAAHGNTGGPYARAHEWLRKAQNLDGGWAPKPAIDTSTCVTSLAVLALCETGFDPSRLYRAVDWLLGEVNPETPPLLRFAFRTLGISPPKAPGGSPWFPGTAAWIAPSVLSVLALSRIARLTAPNSTHYPALTDAIARGQHYILSRKCRDGGWNHGGSSFRSENAESYPEMTDMALLALKDVSSAQIEAPLQRAESFLAHSQSSEALSWLQLGLMCHGRKPQASTAGAPSRTIRDACLRLLALAGPVSENKLIMQSLAS